MRTPRPGPAVSLVEFAGVLRVVDTAARSIYASEDARELSQDGTFPR